MDRLAGDTATRPEQRQTLAREEALDTWLDRLGVIATYIYLFSYVLALGGMSVLSLVRGDRGLGLILGSFAVVALLIVWRVKRSGLDSRVVLLLIAGAVVLYVYLVTGGGYANTALYWCFPIFVAIYHFAGALPGILINLALLSFTAMALLSPGFVDFVPDYGSATVSRFLYTGVITCVLLFLYAMTQQILNARLEQVRQQLFRASITDELTGLANRRYMNEALRERERRSAEDRRLAVVIADVDRFKSVNDTLGHDAGDLVLRHVATVLHDTLRDSDRVARWGGEEFLVLLEVGDADEAAAVVEKMRRAIESAPFDYEGRSVPVTASFGVKTVVDPVDRLQDMVIEADRNLRLAKERGRNRVVAS